jgi:hypothetical protein
MQITLNIPNEQLFEKILWLLNRFKNDGVEIITNMQRVKQLSKKRNKKLVKFEQIINTKSKNSIQIDDFLILNPHSELSNDIS